MVEFDTFNLKNDLACVLVPLKGLKSVTVEVFVQIGSKYESKSQFGMSHFLEHMAFKGTLKRFTAAILNKEIDAKGAIHNASTGHEWTSYHIKTVLNNIPWAIEILSDILFQSQYPASEILKERGVIAEEIGMYDDNPTMGLAFTFMERNLKSNIGCWSITGKVEDVAKITRKKLVDYRNDFMSPKRMVVVVAGDLGNKANQQKIKELMQINFGQWKSKVGCFPTVDVSFAKTKEIVLKKDILQAHFCLGWPGVSWQDKKRFVAKLVEIMLLGNSSSKLWNAIREERGLAYYLFPISEHFKETGLMGLQVGVCQTRLAEALEVTKNELINFGNSVTVEDLERTKDYMTGKIKLSMDQTDFWTDLVGQRMLLFGEVMGVEEIMKLYNKVTIDDVKKFAADYIQLDEFRCLTLTR